MVEPKNGWRGLLKRAGLSDLRMHDLRRTLGSYMSETGSTLEMIGKILGHRSASATLIYARLSVNKTRQHKSTAIKEMLKHRES